jgi:hypothetical protein
LDWPFQLTKIKKSYFRRVACVAHKKKLFRPFGDVIIETIVWCIIAIGTITATFVTMRHQVGQVIFARTITGDTVVVKGVIASNAFVKKRLTFGVFLGGELRETRRLALRVQF